MVRAVKINIEIKELAFSVRVITKNKRFLQDNFEIEVPAGFMLDFLPVDTLFIADIFKKYFLNYKIPDNNLDINFLLPDNLYQSIILLLPPMEKKEIEQEVILAFQKNLQLNPWEYFFAWSESSGESEGVVKINGVAYKNSDLLLFKEILSFLGKKNTVNFLPLSHFSDSVCHPPA